MHATTTNPINITYANVRGIKGKAQSLEHCLSMHDTHIATLTETKLGTIPPRVKGYTWITKNKKEGAGGIAVLVSEKLKNKTKSIQYLDDDDTEILWVEVESQGKPTFIGVIYGKQENAPIEEVERQFQTITTHILTLKQKGKVILTGDMNAKIKINKTNYDGKQISQETSRNGKLLEKMLKDTKTKAISTESKTGLWTRINTKNQNEKSIIDYIIIPDEDSKNVENIEVDEQEIYKISGEKKSDHNTITMTINIPTTREQQTIKRWKVDNKEGWKEFNTRLDKEDREKGINTYEQLQETTVNLLRDTIGEKIIRTGTNKKKSQKLKQAHEDKRIKRKDFKNATKNKTNDIKEKMDEFIKAQKEIKNIIAEEEKIDLEKKFNRFIAEGGIKSQSFWKIRRSILRQDTIDNELITEDDQIVTDPDTAKDLIADYFQNLYQAREADPDEIDRTNAILLKNKETQAKNLEVMRKEELNHKEMRTSIKKLKRHKSTGPDTIPNEVFIEASHQTIEIYRKIFNKILISKSIPEIWRKGTITKIYKGKGKKGKCSNDRGITVSSNVGKVYERIINERCIKMVNISDAQAGGKKGSATTDHLLLLKETIQHHKTKGENIYISFLDVTKAYDKAWLEGIMYALEKNGLNNYLWEITKDMNTNLTATVNTKHGKTKEFPTKDNIRQGGVLSVMMYALLMDEIAKEIDQENLGIQLPNSTKNLGCLLWMDDVVLIHETAEGLQNLLDITNKIAKKYHIAFGKDKSKAMFIGKGNKNQKQEKKLNLGEMEIEYTTSYKYLGETINNKLNMENQISGIKGKVEAAYQTILVIAGDKELKNIRMQVIWKLLETCIKPIITYAAETWKTTQKEIKQLNGIYDKIIKRTLRVPPTTPREILYQETKISDIIHTKEKNQIMMMHRLQNTQNSLLPHLANDNNENSWAQKTIKLMEKYNSEYITDMSTNRAKTHIGKQVKIREALDMEESGNEKSKVKFYMENRQTNPTGKRPKYLDDLTRNEASTIFRGRARMIQAKSNYKNKYTNLMCRGCGLTEESQNHILQECKEIHKDDQIKVTTQELFNNQLNQEQMKEIARRINQIESTLNQKT